MNEIDFEYTYEDENFRYPLFKFMNPIHARALLDQGELYLPPLSSFAKPHSADGSLINDPDEGFFEHIEPDGQAKKTRLPDVWVYCVAAQLVSQSTAWAIHEGKTTCVMIIDPQGFVSCLKKHIDDADFSEFKPCAYTDENRRADQDPDKEKFWWYKPKRYQSQREVRFIAKPKGQSTEHLKGKKICIPDLKKFLIEVDIQGINLDMIKDSEAGKVKNYIHKHNGAIAEFSIDSPSGVFSILVNQDQIGFFSFKATKTFKNGIIRGCNGGILQIPNFTVLAFNEISEVKKIEIVSINN